ncbi:MAG: hypothetical protein QOH41_119 [Blastocatellia bacterium]|jgi:hypothetical protein|nr:hypothetical protein [Blastocatellia bacterium]
MICPVESAHELPALSGEVIEVPVWVVVLLEVSDLEFAIQVVIENEINTIV